LPAKESWNLLLKGKIAIVTGAASGLGAATSKLFAIEGASVVAVDVDSTGTGEVVGEIEAAGGSAAFARADVRSAAELNDVVAYAVETFGNLDIMVANAGILGRASFKPTEDLTDDEWTEVIDLNLGGAFRSFRAAIPAIRRAGGGALSATSSVSGVYSSLYRAAYSASKGGINALIRSLSVELAPDRIRANAVAAGSLGSTSKIHASLGRTPDEIKMQRPDQTVKARMRQPGRDGAADTARVHLFLCSDLGAYVSGEVVVADGGFSIWNGT
jgi:NAD(P)-dependent dehydrogenase (short-subunit alcohol dehydrogenase family)